MSETVGKVLYLCGAIDPQREGISKEVFQLHRHKEKSFLVGTSPAGGCMFSLMQRYLGFPAKMLPTLRYWVPFIEKRFDLLHIFHGIDCYHYLKSRGNKPVILTAISIENILSMDHYKRVQKLVVECNRDREKLLANGFLSEQIEVIYPGTDLSLFNAMIPPPDGRFKVLFASSPFSIEYMEPRGVRLLLEAAKIMIDVNFTLLWRKRGATLGLLNQWVKEMELENVTIIDEDIKQMNRMYSGNHVTIVPFTSVHNTKSCPNSAVESLATGRPVLVSDRVGIADLVQNETCGVVFPPDSASLVAAIEEIRLNYDCYRQNARASAEKYFNENAFIESYERLYEGVFG